LQGIGAGTASRSGGASDGSDRVIVSARVFADVPAPGPLPSDGAKHGQSDDGRWFASFRRETIKAADSSERQSAFESTVAQLRETFAVAGIDADYVQAHRAEVELYVSLAPRNGQAGIVFAREDLAAWDGLNVSIYVDALGE
jgi:hypothetical protein